MVISCHPQEEGLVGWDELGDVPEAGWFAVRVIADWQSFDHFTLD